MQNKIWFSDDVFFVEVTSISIIIFEVFHILFVFEIDHWMQRNDLWFSWWIFYEPVASSFENDHDIVVELIPVFKENFLVLIIITFKYKFFLTNTVKEMPIFLVERRNRLTRKYFF